MRNKMILNSKDFLKLRNASMFSTNVTSVKYVFTLSDILRDEIPLYKSVAKKTEKLN